LMLGCEKKPDESKLKAAADIPIPKASASHYPVPRNANFEYGRDETSQQAAAIYTNFYEFTTSKQTYQFVEKFKPIPWTVSVEGLCANPRTFDIDDLHASFELEERAYRHRCVETWAMCVPWTGFPLKKLIESVGPQADAKFVEFQTFNRPEEADTMSDSSFPWPYTEGLTIEEATNDLALIATGIYGEPLPKQHGTPVRLVIPWKYGFKSIKSIVRITLTNTRPKTFWNVVNPREYGFEANVDPQVSHPRWSQATEWMLGTREQFPTVKYNGYGEYVASLYE
ncbi:MAG: protein-methionine-sulfoxide reductase catalytic subunit MsrP, partial [Planctomycetes bacterium]|nr:protein-methionine-sulfoxide reductase catalytic subunit MsrP [Planctomycetota bacterium]